MQILFSSNTVFQDREIKSKTYGVPCILFQADDVTESIDSYSAQGSDSFALDPVLQFV